MMRFALTLLLASLVAGGTINRDKTWQDFKKTYNKVYRDVGEEMERRRLFEAELDYISRHNALYEAGQSTFTVGVNQFSDWSMAEWHQFLAKTGISADKVEALRGEEEELVEAAAPDTHDWRDHHMVSMVQNQVR